MTETVVHVETIGQWKSVLDVWFEQGYEWVFGEVEYFQPAFDYGSRFLFLSDKKIYQDENSNGHEFIEYADFMEQQEKTMAKETYYVTRKQFDLIEKLKSFQNPLFEISHSTEYVNISTGFDSNGEKSLLRYLGGDTSIEFKAKEQLYRLSGVSLINQVVYFDKTSILLPATTSKENAFTAPLEEIKKWKTPDWEIEKVD